MSTIEERGNSLAAKLMNIENQANVPSSVINDQWYAAILEALRAERRLVLEWFELRLSTILGDASLLKRELEPKQSDEPDKPTESIAETFSRAATERLKPQ